MSGCKDKLYLLNDSEDPSWFLLSLFINDKGVAFEKEMV